MTGFAVIHTGVAKPNQAALSAVKVNSRIVNGKYIICSKIHRNLSIAVTKMISIPVAVFGSQSQQLTQL